MDILGILIGFVILIFSVILHEIAHGFVAERLGDPTARLMGRLTLDPRPHIDPFMSILMPLFWILSTHGQFVFGAAKPVPVDAFNLREGRKDMALVALAGPLTNILLAVIAALIIKSIMTLNTGGVPAEIILILGRIVQVNLLLGFFNLVPIPPLDGSNIFALLLSERDARSYLALSSIGWVIILVLVFMPIGSFSLMDSIGKLIFFTESLLGI